MKSVTGYKVAGWERKGRNSDFQDLSRSFVAIIDAADEDRDDFVVEEIDRLCKAEFQHEGHFYPKCFS